MENYMSEVNSELLHYLFDYNYETGVFIRKIRTSVKINIGDIAGGVGLDGYIRIRVNGKLYLGHRLAWMYVYGVWPSNQIDHINHVKSDNRIHNLRGVTHSENQRNAGIRSDNVSGIVGVNKCKREEKWNSSICLNGARKFLGYYVEKWDAICARKSAEYSCGFHVNHGKTI